MIQGMLAIWSLVPLPFLNPAWTPGSSRFTYCWSLDWKIFSITLPACKSFGVIFFFFMLQALKTLSINQSLNNVNVHTIKFLTPQKNSIYISTQLCISTRILLNFIINYYEYMFKFTMQYSLVWKCYSNSSLKQWFLTNLKSQTINTTWLDDTFLLLWKCPTILYTKANIHL